MKFFHNLFRQKRKFKFTIMDTTLNKSVEAFKVTGDWALQSAQLKGKYAQLTDADLKYEVGKDEELLTRLETKLNKKREEVINIIRKGETAKA